MIVKPQKRDDSDLGDVIALARSVGKQVLKTHIPLFSNS